MLREQVWSKHCTEMWKRATSIKHKERCNFNLCLFCSFLYNFEEMMIKLAIFFSVLDKKTLSNFLLPQNFFLLIDFCFQCV